MPYFAYCTLLDEAEMRRFVPTARLGAPGRIDGQRVVFERHGPELETGGCNLSVAEGQTVHGVLYDLTDDEFAQLDLISGVDRGLYRRVAVRVMTEVGAVDAETYVIPHPGESFRPTAAYTRPILAGARALGMAHDYIARLEALIADSTA